MEKKNYSIPFTQVLGFVANGMIMASPETPSAPPSTDPTDEPYWSPKKQH